MIHCFKYRHNDRDFHFLWDIESGSLHNVDSATFFVAKQHYLQLTPAETEQYNLISEPEKQEILDELLVLEQAGTINSPCNVTQKAKHIGEIKALCLHICHDCNMRCKYCFADDGTYHTARCKMSLEVGKKAIDFLIANSGNHHNLEVDFFGGEPLMNLGVVKQIVSYAKKQEVLFDKKFSFTLTTNCLALDDKTIDFLNKEMFNVVLSIDGRPEVHNAVRRSINNKDTQDVILKNALKFRAVRGDKSYYVRGTFTAKNLDFAKDVLYLNDSGFDQISIEPVVTTIDDLKISESHLPQIFEQYEILAEEYIKRRQTDKWFNFFHFMLDLEGGPCISKRLTGCGAGCEYLSVTPNGDIYPCHQFAEENGYLIGNVLKGDFCLDISEQFSKNIVTQKEECQKCFAKYYCSGGCAANNTHYAGNMQNPYKISCEMMRKRFELSLAINAIEGDKNC
ncbi:MAG: thioether cross-link-forming SCIFF peptide maturase [Clostridia bacterium]